jgi:hypothetical protein
MQAPPSASSAAAPIDLSFLRGMIAKQEAEKAAAETKASVDVVE